MAANPDVVQAVLDKAEADGRIVSRSQVLKAIKERDIAKRVADKLKAERDEARRTREMGALDATALQSRQRFRDQLLEKRNVAEETLAALTSEAEEKRAKLNDAIKEVKILENLKDKTLERELEDAKRKDDKATDDLTNQLESIERQRVAKEE